MKVQSKSIAVWLLIFVMISRDCGPKPNWLSQQTLVLSPATIVATVLLVMLVLLL